MSDLNVNYVFSLYIATQDAATDKQVYDLREALRNSLPEGTWILNMVDVVSMPEKALINDVFTTPTLVRELPPPVVKILGNLAESPKLMAVITRINRTTQTLVL